MNIFCWLLVQLQVKVTSCLAKYKPGAQIRTDFTTFTTPQFAKVGFSWVMLRINETSFQICGMSLAIWDQAVLPATRHKWTHPALIQPQASTSFTYPVAMGGWVDLGDWLHTEMVYPPTYGHPSKFQVLTQ